MSEAEIVHGFSTLLYYSAEVNNEVVNVIFSGDTIIDHRYWAKNDFAAAWTHFVGGLQAAAPHIPLYWFLIVKGHRTYRYLKLFSREYYPAPSIETPPRMKRLMDALARERFGDNYDPARGIVTFPETRGYLKEPWAKIEEAARSRPEIDFFMNRNPNFWRGDELVCICRLEPENLTSRARQRFVAAREPAEVNLA